MTDSLLNLIEEENLSDVENVVYEFYDMDCDPPSTKSLFHDPEVLEGRMTKGMTIVLLIVAILTILINIGVIIRIYKLYKNGVDFKPAFSFIGNLAVSDFLIGLYIVVVFCVDLTQLSTEWRDNCCGVLNAIAVTACEETICTITLIAIDKYIFICHGLSYRRIVTDKVVTASIVVSWLISLLIGFMPAMGLHEENWCACNFALYISKGFSIVLFITAVVIPLIIITTLYSIILSLAIRVTRKKMDTSSTSSKGFRTFQLTFKSKSSKSSDMTISSKLSSSETPSCSNKPTTPDSNANRKLRNNRNSEVLRNDSDLKGKDTCSETKENSSALKTLPGLKTSSLPTVYELRETCLMPQEIDSGEESDNEDSSDSGNTSSKNSYVSSDSRKKKREGSYDFINPSQRSSSRLENQESSSSNTVHLRSYKSVNEESGESSFKQTSPKNSKKEKVTAESKSIETISGENVQSSDSGQSDRVLYFKRKASYFKKVLQETKDKVQFLQKCRAVKPILLILFCFVITYVPFVTGTLAFKVQKDKSERLFKALNNLFYLAVVLNSLMNPFVYAYGYKEFRIKTKKFKGILAKKKRPKPY